MTGARSRRKGHDFEREFCRWVRDEFGIEFGRNLKQYGEAQHGDTDPLAIFLPECKALGPAYQTRAHKRKAWRQACAQAKRAGLQPLVVWKVPGQRECSFVAMLRDPSGGDADWSWGFDYRKEVEPPLLALIVREHMGAV